MEEVNTVGKSFLDLWLHENISDFGSMGYRILETLYSGRSKFQQVDVVRTAGHGVMLFIDGLAMVSERDEFVYHDMIAHVPLFSHPQPKRVLIIGGGDGGTAREVLRHTHVEACTMVEIDALVVDVSRKYLPQTSCALDDPRLTLRIDDGVKFMAETEARFDVVIIDSTDPIGPAAPLFGEKFYNDVHRVLNPGGIAVAQGESPFYEPKAQTSILTNLRKSFPKAYLYNYANLTYPGGIWSFAMASKGPCPIADFSESRVAACGLTFKYYTAGLHRAAFQLPQFQLNLYPGLLTALQNGGR